MHLTGEHMFGHTDRLERYNALNLSYKCYGYYVQMGSRVIASTSRSVAVFQRYLRKTTCNTTIIPVNQR
jgi:N-acetyl-anhydromuramyl-L-alanine amidase AmpD